jgi:hypothetical protein
MSTEHLRATVDGLLAAELGSEVGPLNELLAPDFVEEYPQSRERVLGPDGVVRLLNAHPSRPRGGGTPRVTVLGADQAAFEVAVRYGDEPWWIIGILDLRDGLVHRERAYFASRLPPADWRAPWVVPIPEVEASEGIGGHEAVDRSVVERYFTAQSEADLPTLTRMRHPEWVHDMPQAGERFPTPDSYVEAHAHYPGGMPALTPLRLSGPGDQWVVGASSVPLRVSGHGAHWFGEVELSYPNGERWFDILLMGFRDGKVVAERSYWCLPFDPPEWRRGLTERY